jgi:hypothetical protein
MDRSPRLASSPLFTISTRRHIAKFQIEAQPTNFGRLVPPPKIVEFSFDREDPAFGRLTRVRRAYPR